MYDLVIVGAGISGAYTAFRIARRWRAFYMNGTKLSSRPPKILIIDSQARIGGRISSIPLKPVLPVPLFQAEFCAMRFYTTIQPNITNLVSELNSMGGPQLVVSVIPAANVPLLTPVFPAIDAQLQLAYPPSQTARNAKIDLTTAITLATGNYTDAQTLAESIGYTYLQNGMNLYAYYSDAPLAGFPENRFANGFQGLIQKLIDETRSIYRSAYCEMVRRGDEEVINVSQEEFESRFTVMLGTVVNSMEDVTYVEHDSDQTIINLESLEKKNIDTVSVHAESSSSSAPSTPHTYNPFKLVSNAISNVWSPSTPIVTGSVPSYSAEAADINIKIEIGDEETTTMTNTEADSTPSKAKKCKSVFSIGLLDGCHSCEWYIESEVIVYTGSLAQFQTVDLRGWDSHNVGEDAELMPPANIVTNNNSVGRKKRRSSVGKVEIPTNESTKKNTNVYSSNASNQDAISHLNRRRTMAFNLFTPHPGFKMYFYFTQPWWNPAIYGKFCAHPLINQMIYYSPNVILVYTLGPQSDTLYDMFVQDLLATGMSNDQISQSSFCHNWINATVVPQIVNYFKSKVVGIIASAIVPQPSPTPAQLNSLSMVAVHHIDQALNTPVAETSPSLFQNYEFIRSGNGSGNLIRGKNSSSIIDSNCEAKLTTLPKIEAINTSSSPVNVSNPSSSIFYLSGDVTNIGGGWSEYCITNVNQYIPDIESKLY